MHVNIEQPAASAASAVSRTCALSAPGPPESVWLKKWTPTSTTPSLMGTPRARAGRRTRPPSNRVHRDRRPRARPSRHPELTDELDIGPSLKDRNLRRLDEAFAELAPDAGL